MPMDDQAVWTANVLTRPQHYREGIQSLTGYCYTILLTRRDDAICPKGQLGG